MILFEKKLALIGIGWVVGILASMAYVGYYGN
jgi:hypothetical protein